jgi:hypothetical protein
VKTRRPVASSRAGPRTALGDLRLLALYDLCPDPFHEGGRFENCVERPIVSYCVRAAVGANWRAGRNLP